jgi:type I restriction enzyme M protein
MVDRRHRELGDDDVKKISETYHAWRGELKHKEYHEIPGFSKSASLDEIRRNGWILTPGRFVGAEEEADEDEPFEEKMEQFTSELAKQMNEGAVLEAEIKKNLKNVGYEI